MTQSLRLDVLTSSYIGEAHREARLAFTALIWSEHGFDTAWTALVSTHQNLMNPVSIVVSVVLPMSPSCFLCP